MIMGLRRAVVFLRRDIIRGGRGMRGLMVIGQSWVLQGMKRFVVQLELLNMVLVVVSGSDASVVALRGKVYWLLGLVQGWEMLEMAQS